MHPSLFSTISLSRATVKCWPVFLKRHRVVTVWLFLDSLSTCPGVSFDSLGRVEDLSGIKIQWSWVNGLLRCQVLHVADASQSSICDVMGKKESWHFSICIDVHGCAHCGRATALVCKSTHEGCGSCYRSHS